MFDQDTTVGTLDLMFLLLAGFVALVFLMWPHLNPPEEKKVEHEEPPGNVIVEVKWPDEYDVDVDTWLLSPVSIAPVGYTNKSGPLWNLLRDDVGFYSDVIKMNYENAYTRGIVDGEYQVNVHLFRNACEHSPPAERYGQFCDKRAPYPVEVQVVVKVKKDPKKVSKVILHTTTKLEYHSDEKTVFRFKLDKDSDLVAGSVNQLHRKLAPSIAYPGM